MGLLHKVRVLIGAWVHKPFVSKPEKIERVEKPGAPGEGGQPPDSSALEALEQQVQDEERVADLIARRREAD